MPSAARSMSPRLWAVSMATEASSWARAMSASASAGDIGEVAKVAGGGCLFGDGLKRVGSCRFLLGLQLIHQFTVRPWF